jgi:hypothetical protein
VKIERKSIHLIIFGLLSFAAGVSSAPTFHQTIKLTFHPEEPLDVRGKKALFVGDSHTSAYGWGWQDQVCNHTGMVCKNTAAPGKQTNWMAWKLDTYADSSYSYCFIYGGGNDVAAGVPNSKILQNFRAMISHCQRLRIEPIVITGADPTRVISPSTTYWKNYCSQKSKLQQMLVDSLPGIVVIDTRKAIDKSDCADFLCHTKAPGQRKIAQEVIAQLDFKKVD